MASQAYEQLDALGGESVTYTPYGGQGRTILALLDPIRRTDAMGNVQILTKTYEVFIVRSAAEGIATVKAGYDTLTVKLEPSDVSVTTLRVTKVLPDRDRGTPGDGVGMWHLEAVV